MYLYEQKELVSFLCFGERKVERIICHNRGRQGEGGQIGFVGKGLLLCMVQSITPPGWLGFIIQLHTSECSCWHYPSYRGFSSSPPRGACLVCMQFWYATFFSWWSQNSMKGMCQTLEGESKDFIITVCKPPSWLKQNLGKLCMRATHTI